MNNWEPQQRLFSLTEGVAIVHRDKNGKVSPNWLYSCKESRHSTVGLMEKIAAPSNIQKAYRKVRSNDGSPGVDGMTTQELRAWLIVHQEDLCASLLSGRYQPSAVRGIEIPKPQGGYRQLGIPTVKDRLVQQAILQVLTPLYEGIFSAESHGFRPDRSAHGALKTCQRYVQSGKRVVVDVDLEKFFDEVNHSRLMWLLSRRLGDARLLELIRRFIKSGILVGGLESQRLKGTPQGGPLSPLLSNIILDELDKELERRGHSYVRYADDVKVFVRSQAAGARVMQRMIEFVGGVLKLKVNESKSRVCMCWELNFLGYSILHTGGLALSKGSLARVKTTIRQLTRRNRGISLGQMMRNLEHRLSGWVVYFSYASMSKHLSRLDSWIRRRLRCFRLKQCKRVIGIVRWLSHLGVERTLSWRTALSGKGWWCLSNSPGTSIGMSNTWFTENGYYSLLSHYRSLQR